MIFAMFAMVMLTFIIGFVAIRTRVASVKSGAVKLRYFRLMQGQDVPDQLTKSTRCFNNMFETPVLFYVVGVLFVALEQNSLLSLIVAWAYVFSRYLHTWIHLTYNNVLHRMQAFWFGLICIFVLWLILLYQQL